MYIFFQCYEIGICCVAQAGLKLNSLLPQMPACFCFFIKCIYPNDGNLDENYYYQYLNGSNAQNSSRFRIQWQMSHVPRCRYFLGIRFQRLLSRDQFCSTGKAKQVRSSQLSQLQNTAKSSEADPGHFLEELIQEMRRLGKSSIRVQIPTAT